MTEQGIPSLHAAPKFDRLRELSALFLKLGSISFGGPAAHIALIEAEIVRKRQWVTRHQFLDMLGAANLIPGPTSTEMAINTGFVRAGWPGLCVAGASFILPAALSSGGFAWAYVRFGTTPQLASILTGIKPAVLAVIAIAIWRLGKTAIKDAGLAVLGAAALAAFFLLLNPIVVLFGGGLIGMLVRQAPSLRTPVSLLVPFRAGNWSFSLRSLPIGAAGSVVAGTIIVRPSIGQVGLFFLDCSSWIVLPESWSRVVRRRLCSTGIPGARTDPAARMDDTAAVARCRGDRTVHSGASAFDGNVYWIHSWGRAGSSSRDGGDLSAVVFYVALLAPILFRLRQSSWIAAFLDSVNVCAVALMAGVT